MANTSARSITISEQPTGPGDYIHVSVLYSPHRKAYVLQAMEAEITKDGITRISLSAGHAAVIQTAPKFSAKTLAELAAAAPASDLYKALMERFPQLAK